MMLANRKLKIWKSKMATNEVDLHHRVGTTRQYMAGHQKNKSEDVCADETEHQKTGKYSERFHARTKKALLNIYITISKLHT